MRARCPRAKSTVKVLKLLQPTRPALVQALQKAPERVRCGKGRFSAWGIMSASAGKSPQESGQSYITRTHDRPDIIILGSSGFEKRAKGFHVVKSRPPRSHSAMIPNSGLKSDAHPGSPGRSCYPEVEAYNPRGFKTRFQGSHSGRDRPLRLLTKYAWHRAKIIRLCAMPLEGGRGIAMDTMVHRAPKS